MHMDSSVELYEKHREVILYLVCGALTVLVSLGTYTLFVWMGVEINFSNILSWICAVLFAFVINKWIVFMSRSVKKTVLAKEVTSFFFLRIVTGLVAILAFPLLHEFGLNQSLFGTDGFFAKVTVMVIEILLNYLASKFIVFRNIEEDA